MNCSNCGQQSIPDDSRFCPECGKPVSQANSTSESHDKAQPKAGDDFSTGRVAVDFIDFQIRAWCIEADQVQIMVHSSPVSNMRKPIDLQIDGGVASLHELAQAAWSERPGREEFVHLGRLLTQTILPMPIYIQLVRSLDSLRPGQGLRLRLCLDDALVDLPWELLYRAEVIDESLAGFLLMDPRVSIVREPPTCTRNLLLKPGTQRMVFAGAFCSQGDDEDAWKVQREYSLLKNALQPIEQFVRLDSFVSAADDQITDSLSETTAIFHYSGHADVQNGKGCLVKKTNGQSTDWLSSEVLGLWLQRTGAQLGVFSACNSGRWRFVGPLIEAGLPAVIGAYGDVDSESAITFCENLYTSLAIGLSIDESVAMSRLYLLDRASDPDAFEWASFMVYMPSPDAILIPQPKNQMVSEMQHVKRSKHEQIIINQNNIVQYVGTVTGGGSVTGANLQ